MEEAEAIQELKAFFEKNGKKELLYAIDVNSKFEEEAGCKNVEKLKEFKKRF
jgi:phosphoribosylanthranilate isomerase